MFIYLFYSFIYFLIYLKYYFRYLKICLTEYRAWIIAAFNLWFYFEILFLGYCLDVLQLKFYRIFFKFLNKFKIIKLSKRKKLFFRFFYLVFSDKFVIFEVFFNKVKKNFFFCFPTKRILCFQELLNTTIMHINLFNNLITKVEKQLLLAQYYIDFFEQKTVFLKLLKKEGLFFNFNLKNKKLKFISRNQAIQFKARREKRLLRLINARKYFFRAHKILFKKNNNYTVFLLKSKYGNNRTVNSLMRELLFERYSVILFIFICLFIFIYFIFSIYIIF